MTEQILGFALVCPIHTLFGVDSAINPSPTSSGAIALQALDIRKLIPVIYCIAVNFFKHGLRMRLRMFAVSRIIPSKRAETGIARMGILLHSFLEAPSQVVHEPNFTARIARRIDRLVAILQKPLGVGEGSRLFSGARCREHEYLGCNSVG